MDYKQLILDNLPEGVELTEKTIANITRDIKKAVGEAFIPKEQYSKKTTELENVRLELEGVKGNAGGQGVDIETLRGLLKTEKAAHATTKADLGKLLADEKTAHEATRAGHETAKVTETKKAAVLKQLIEDGANEKFAKIVAREFDIEKIELDGDKIKNWDEIAKPHKEEFADVFEQAGASGFSPSNPPKEGQEGQAGEFKFDFAPIRPKPKEGE